MTAIAFTAVPTSVIEPSTISDTVLLTESISSSRIVVTDGVAGISTGALFTVIVKDCESVASGVPAAVTENANVPEQLVATFVGSNFMPLIAARVGVSLGATVVPSLYNTEPTVEPGNAVIVYVSDVPSYARVVSKPIDAIGEPGTTATLGKDPADLNGRLLSGKDITALSEFVLNELAPPVEMLVTISPDSRPSA